MDDATITAAIVSQYQAALAMFRGAITAMPDAKWDDRSDVNPTWRIAYHVLYFTHLYVSGSENAYVPWGRALFESMAVDEPFALPNDAPAYAVEEILAYADAIEAMLPEAVPVRPYDGPSGFAWISISRNEHLLYTIRHLQHHTGQLFERVRANGGGGLEWRGRGAAARLVPPLGG